ncbi:MAG: putative metal-dependent hydrolase [Spirochaetaceae bacterium]|nr:putative metal-dependent hydrolase [Spirochaetaceae bacterium]
MEDYANDTTSDGAVIDDSRMEALRFPIGRFEEDPQPTRAKHKSWIDQIGRVPGELRALVQDLSERQLDTPYRPDGWTVRQVVHHIADSHLNAYVRTKLALTEEEPTIKPYDEAAWAELPDGSTAPIESSMSLLEALHARWVATLRDAEEGAFKRTLNHPEQGVITISRIVQSYAWHGRHHIAHVNALRDKMGWW